MTWIKQGVRVIKKDTADLGAVGTIESLEKVWINWYGHRPTYGTITYWEEVLRPIEKDKKDSNPKDGIGMTKAALSCLPLPAIMEGSLAMMEGSLKYGRHNYRVAGVRYSVYFDAMIRHLFAWFEGEDQAQDSKVHHLGHIMAGCAILLDDILAAEPKGNDDRPPITHAVGWMPEFNRRVAELKKRYPQPVPPYTQAK